MPASAFPMPVYDGDDRREPSEVGDGTVRAMVDSTVALFNAEQVPVRDGWAHLPTKPFGKTVPLCEGERFSEQAAGADCSGALVGPDLVLTAGHCVKSKKDCAKKAFVFGYRIDNGEGAARVPARDVFSCGALVARRLSDKTGSDWAIVRLDRPVPGRRALAVDPRPVTLETPLLVIGHPSGLPAKVAANGRVRDASPEAFYKTDLDAFSGNSGSPVFHAGTGGIVGVLVRGEEDFEAVVRPDGSKCLKAKVCRDGGCQGEAVTKVSEFLPALSGGLASSSPVSDKPVASFASPALETLKQRAQGRP